jgi:ribosomal protein S7
MHLQNFMKKLAKHGRHRFVEKQLNNVFKKLKRIFKLNIVLFFDYVIHKLKPAIGMKVKKVGEQTYYYPRYFSEKKKVKESYKLLFEDYKKTNKNLDLFSRLYAFFYNLVHKRNLKPYLIKNYTIVKTLDQNKSSMHFR